MFGWLLNYLEKKGRRIVLVDFYGNILFNRYCLFYLEPPEKVAFWPNVYIQNFNSTIGLDGPSTHVHPWAALGVILKGGYSENWNGVMRERKAGNIHFSTRRDYHGIAASKVGTWTIFGHWFRTGNWEIKLKPCETVCPTCLSTTGQCERINKIYQPEEIIDPVENDFKWRSPRFMVMSPEVDRKLRIRRKASAKVNLPLFTEVDELAEYKFKSK